MASIHKLHLKVYTPNSLMIFSHGVNQIYSNDGFIKLGNAAQFEAREIVKYHATAEPEFRSGKFQL